MHLKVNYNRKAYHLEEYEDFAVLYDITYRRMNIFKMLGFFIIFLLATYNGEMDYLPPKAIWIPKDDNTYTIGDDFELDESGSLKYVFLKSLYKKWWFTSELPFIIATLVGIGLFALISVGVVKAEAYWALLLTLPVIVMLVCIFYKFFVKKKKEYLSQYEMLEI